MEFSQKDLENKKGRRISSLSRLVAEFLNQNIESGVLATVTRVTLSKDGKNGTVFATIYPEEREREVMEAFKKKRKGLRLFLKEKGAFRQVPDFAFMIDIGEKNRRNIDSLIEEENKNP